MPPGRSSGWKGRLGHCLNQETAGRVEKIILLFLLLVELLPSPPCTPSGLPVSFKFPGSAFLAACSGSLSAATALAQNRLVVVITHYPTHCCSLAAAWVHAAAACLSPAASCPFPSFACGHAAASFQFPAPSCGHAAAACLSPTIPRGHAAAAC